MTNENVRFWIDLTDPKKWVLHKVNDDLESDFIVVEGEMHWIEDDDWYSDDKLKKCWDEIEEVIIDELGFLPDFEIN